MGEDEKSSGLTESEISMLLDTYMYLNYYEADEGQCLADILCDLAELKDYGGGGLHYGEYTILAQAVKEHASLGQLQISAQSFALGFDSGTRACIFREDYNNTVYVVYRGTGDGEWMDNGLGMTLASTVQQERALEYFEKAAGYAGLSADQRVVVTGHSKGGNKAQYVTMETSNSDLIDACYSIDGQGFSDAAIKAWTTKYQPAEYQQRIGKLYGIQGENDYVNVLGHCIIPQEHIRYIHTPAEKNNFAGFHDIKYMYAAVDEAGNTFFTGNRNHFVIEQGALGIFAGTLSDKIMQLEPGKREGCAAAIMQLMELGGEQKTGLNGEKLTLDNVADFLSSGLPAMLSTVLYTEGGLQLLNFYFNNSQETRAVYEVQPLLLAKQGENIAETAAKVLRTVEELEAVTVKLEGAFKYGFPYNIGVCKKVKKELENIKREAELLNKLAETLRLAAEKYVVCEQCVAFI